MTSARDVAGKCGGRFAGKLGGFTLIELLTALLVLSLLALMSYRGLGAVLDAREHVRQESEKWRHVATFLARFERDVQLAAPRPVRTASGILPAWIGRANATLLAPRLEFSRFASSEGMDSPRRIAYQLNDHQEIELWLWPGLDVAPNSSPKRYPVLTGVSQLELQYLNANLVWMNAWPSSALDAPMPLALRLRIVLVSSEEIVRIFALNS
jgi:general secretion pathway protein J